MASNRDPKRLIPYTTSWGTTRFGNATAVNTWNTYTWKPALAAAGIIPQRDMTANRWQWKAAPQLGFHVLRHTYSSIMPEAGTRGRTAIDGLLGREEVQAASRNSPDSPQGDCGPIVHPGSPPRSVDYKAEEAVSLG